MLMVFTMFITSCITAGAVQTPATFTLSSGSCYVGETIQIDVSLKTTEAVNTIGLANFTYDSDVFEFVSFSDIDPAIEDMMTLGQLDSDKKIIVIGLDSAETLDNKLCSMTFKVKADAPEGTYQISATSPSTKKSSTIVASSVVPATIVVSKPVTIIAAGICGDNGDNATWSLDTEGLLTISGTGAMADYTYSDDTPWYEYYESVKNIVIGNGITKIGSYAFDQFKNVTDLTIPASITTISSSAFRSCSITNVNITDLAAWCNIKTSGWNCNPLYWAQNFNLNGEKITDLVIPDNITTINNYVFYGYRGLTSVTLHSNVTNVYQKHFFGFY